MSNGEHVDPSFSPGPARPLMVATQPVAYAPVMQAPPVRNARRRVQEPDLNLGFLWSSWCRWWKVLLPVSLLMIVATTGLVLFLSVPEYKGDAFLVIRQVPDFVMKPTNDAGNRSFVQTEIEFLRSAVVLGKLLERPDVAQLPQMKRNDNLKWLSKHLEITSKENSEFFKVSVTTSDPYASATLVNAIVDSYLELQEKNEQDHNVRKIDHLLVLQSEKQELVSRKKHELESLLTQVFEKDPSASTPLDRRMVIGAGSDPFGELQKELRDTEVNISVIEASIKAENEIQGQDRGVQHAAILQMVESDPSLAIEKTKLNQSRDLLARYEMTAKGGADNSRYLRQQREIVSQERRVDALRSSLKQQYEEHFALVTQAQQQDRLNAAMMDLEQEKVKRDHLQQQMIERKHNMKESSEYMTDVEFAQHEYDQARDLLNGISARVNELQTEAGAESRVQLKKKADVPTVAEPMGLWKKLLAALAASCALPFGLAVLWERAACRITSADQLEGQMDLPVIGEVARLPVRVTSNGRTRNASNRGLVMFEECIDAIRTNLLLHREQGSIQVIAICSSVASEGKTSVSSQLAISLARATGQPTLLIDGDMRAPDLHGIFDIPNTPGLVRVLDGQATVQESINRDWSEHVHILPAGEIYTSPHKLLGQDQFRRLLDEVRPQYRYIVVDTPPILAASEALMMAANADGVLVCAMHERSRGNHARMTYERLMAAGAKPIGAVLNGVSTRAYAYKYGSYYYGDGKYRYAYTRTK